MTGRCCSHRRVEDHRAIRPRCYRPKVEGHPVYCPHCYHLQKRAPYQVRMPNGPALQYLRSFFQVASPVNGGALRTSPHFHSSKRVNEGQETCMRQAH